MAPQFLHALAKKRRRGMDPVVSDVRHPMKLQDDGPLPATVQDASEEVKRPSGHGVSGRRNQQCIVAVRVKGEACIQRAVVEFGRESATGQPVSEPAQLLQCLGAEAVAAPREADRLLDADLGELVLDQRQLALQTRGVLGNGKVGMRPGVVSDLEPHFCDLGDLVPRHEVLAVVHPSMGDEECRGKAQIRQVRRNEVPVRRDGVIKCQHCDRVGRLATQQRGGSGCRSASEELPARHDGRRRTADRAAHRPTARPNEAIDSL